MIFIYLLIAALVVVIDQVIKYFVCLHLKPIGFTTAIPHLLDLVYVENRGVAFGMFTDMRWIFVALTSVLIIGIIVYMFWKKPAGKFFYICAALIVGGGIGNLIDRIFYGYVIDYLSLSFFPPVCNFADYCITAGTVMLIIYVMFFAESKKADANKPELNKVINNND